MEAWLYAASIWGKVLYVSSAFVRRTQMTLAFLLANATVARFAPRRSIRHCAQVLRLMRYILDDDSPSSEEAERSTGMPSAFSLVRRVARVIPRILAA